MKTRLLWIAMIAVGGTALYCAIMKPEVSTIPKSLRQAADELKPPLVPAPEVPPLVVAPVVLTPPEIAPRALRLPELPVVPIQSGTTIDFSAGGPVVKRDGADKEALEQALKEIAEVTEGVSIQPRRE